MKHCSGISVAGTLTKEHGDGFPTMGSLRCGPCGSIRGKQYFRPTGVPGLPGVPGAPLVPLGP